MNRSHIIRMNAGCVYEDIDTTHVWDDETKAFGPYPTVDSSTLEVARGAILGPGHFWTRSGALGTRKWCMVGKHLMQSARRYARYNWARKWVR